MRLLNNSSKVIKLSGVFIFCAGRCMSAKLTGTSQAKESEELKNYSLTLETPIGLLKITANDKAIIAIKHIEVEKNRLLSEDANELVKKCAQELKGLIFKNRFGKLFKKFLMAKQELMVKLHR